MAVYFIVSLQRYIKETFSLLEKAPLDVHEVMDSGLYCNPFAQNMR